ncbi:MAG: DUF2232 domain-containing protein [Erysipelothrix sp.]|nr:DUF2232 domain-containing protein [Erysipelothrix sp.]
MKSNVRRITDGAMIVAIMGLLIVLDGQSGMLLDGILFWFIPIPIIIYVVKYNLNDGIVVAVSVTLLAFIISLPHLALLIGFSSLIGLAYGYGINRKLNITKTLLITLITTVIYYFLSMIVFAKFFGYDPVAEIAEIINFFTNILDNTTKSGIDAVTFLRWTNPFFAMLILFVPFLPIVISVLQTLVTHLFSVVLLKRLKLADIEIKPFYTISVSKKVGIMGIIVLILSYAYFILGIKGYNSIVVISQFLAQLVFIISGSILLLTIIAVKQKPILSPLVGLLIIVFPLIVMVLGIIDVFTELRINFIRRAVNER